MYGKYKSSFIDFLKLGKPRSALLLSYTGVSSYIYYKGLLDQYTLMLFILGFLATFGANTLNCYLDRDIDAVMERTKNRPLPMKRISPRTALYTGVFIISPSTTIFTIIFNIYSGTLLLLGAIYYIVIYTLILKRNTSLNIILGGIAGSIPPLVGWLAADPYSSIEAIIMAIIIFLWTPSHFWSLEIVYLIDYLKAGIPTLLSKQDRQNAYCIVTSYLLTSLSTFILTFYINKFFYLIASLSSISIYLLLSYYLLRNNIKKSLLPFKLSNLSLFITFTGMMLSKI